MYSTGGDRVNKARSFLIRASHKLDLPADIIASVPRTELIGAEECRVEPQKGLLEYSEEKISVDTSVGVMTVYGRKLNIKRMNSTSITITGDLQRIDLPGGYNE